MAVGRGGEIPYKVSHNDTAKNETSLGGFFTLDEGVYFALFVVITFVVLHFRCYYFFFLHIVSKYYWETLDLRNDGCADFAGAKTLVEKLK